MKNLKKVFYIDMHTSPAVVLRSSFNEQNIKCVEKYIGRSKWVKTSEDDLTNLLKAGSAREVEKTIADEFIKDFDTQNNF